MPNRSTDLEGARRRGRRQVALLWGAASLLLILVSPFGPWIAGRVGSCPMKTWTGLPCPTCGTTRAALALAELRPLEALVAYPLPTLGWVAFIAGGLLAGATVLAGRDLPGLPRRLPLWVRGGLVAGVLLNWIYIWQTGV